MKTLKLEIYGRVQGVNFRRSVKEFADENAIRGQVKNLDDGAVEVIAQADEEKLRKFVSWAKRNPGFSKVKNVLVEELDEEKNYEDFRVVREDSFLLDKKRSLSNFGKSFWKF